jgi:hypothetical protein
VEVRVKISSSYNVASACALPGRVVQAWEAWEPWCTAHGIDVPDHKGNLPADQFFAASGGRLAGRNAIRDAFAEEFTRQAGRAYSRQRINQAVAEQRLMACCEWDDIPSVPFCNPASITAAAAAAAAKARAPGGGWRPLCPCGAGSVAITSAHSVPITNGTLLNECSSSWQ